MIAILQTALYGIAGPSHTLTGYLMVGIGLSALIMHLLRMLILAVYNNYEGGALIFFTLSGLFLLICAFRSFQFI